MSSEGFKARVGKGRPKGAPNKVTRELKALAAQYTKKNVKRLEEIAGTKAKKGEEGDDLGYTYHVDSRLKAIGLMLDRAHGKAPVAITGEGGEGPVVISKIERIIVEFPKRDGEK